jgi:hypothetical protein
MTRRPVQKSATGNGRERKNLFENERSFAEMDIRVGENGLSVD